MVLLLKLTLKHATIYYAKVLRYFFVKEKFANFDNFACLYVHNWIEALTGGQKGRVGSSSQEGGVPTMTHTKNFKTVRIKKKKFYIKFQ